MSATLAPPTPPTDEDVLPRLRTDLRFYSGVCLRIRTKDAKLTAFDFNEPQLLVHRKITAQLRATGRVRAIILKARQEGISTYVAARFTRRTTLWRNQLAMVIADKKERSSDLFGIYERFYDHLPQEVRPTKKTAIRGLRLAFDRSGGTGLDSAIRVETAKDVKAGRSLTVQALHASEIAFWENADDVWISVMQAVPTDGSEVIVESTANGVGNRFHRMWLAAEAGGSGWLAIFLPWWIHREYQKQIGPDEEAEILATASPWERAALKAGIEWEGKRWKLTLGQLAWRRQKITENFEGDERAFRQEYPATAREAFLVSGNGFFDEERLQEYEEAARPPAERGNLVGIEGGIIFRKAERGYLRVWERRQKAAHYVIFADTAQGRLVAARDTSFSDPEGERGGRDFSSADVVRLGYWREDPPKGRGKEPTKVWVPPAQVAQLHGRMAPEVFAEGLKMLGYWYACDDSGRRDAALIGVERNHDSGQTVLRCLKDAGYPKLFWHHLVNKTLNKVTPSLGWVTSGETRPLMLDELAALVRTSGIEIPSAESIRECFTFVRGDDGKPQGQEGCHDDRVIALAGAVQMIRHHTAPTKGRVSDWEPADTPTGI